jgi:hypothetical protein
MSKKSKQLGLYPELSAILRQMHDNGEIERLVNQFFKDLAKEK